jgi:hypothetical protein
MMYSRRYVLDPENWVELGMIGLICAILFTPDTTDTLDMKRHLAAIRQPVFRNYYYYFTSYFTPVSKFVQEINLCK